MLRFVIYAVVVAVAIAVIVVIALFILNAVNSAVEALSRNISRHSAKAAPLRRTANDSDRKRVVLRIWPTDGTQAIPRNVLNELAEYVANHKIERRIDLEYVAGHWGAVARTGFRDAAPLRRLRDSVRRRRSRP